MARTRKRTRTQRRKPLAAQQAEASGRVSTRRESTNRSRAARQPAGRARAAAQPPAETLPVTFALRDVFSQPIRDPETFFTFRRLSDSRQRGDQIALALTGAPVTFKVPVETGEVFVCEIDPRRFRFVHSPVFFASPGPPIAKTIQLLREPKEWTPRFAKWTDLSSTFDPLKAVLEKSPNVTLFKQDDRILGDLLVGSAYDGMTAEDVTLAKTALLNIYFRLNEALEPVSAGRSWFSLVTRIIAIGRERFLAFVDPEMETLVERIHQHVDEFRADYERTPSENHRGNVPAIWRHRITKMISVKSTHRKGNFQLTLSHLASPDQVLLDADIDESGDLFGHFADLFKHKITGGTHPHDIHELLVLQNRDVPGFDLGYRLV